MKRCIGWVVAVLLAATCAAAEWKIGASVGMTGGGDVEDRDVAPGLQATWVLDDTWSVEFGIAQFSDTGGEVEEGVLWAVEVDATPITATLLASTELGGGIRGYAGAGIGYYLVDAEGSAEIRGSRASAATWEVDADNGYGLQVVAGVEADLTESLFLFADLRYAMFAYDYRGRWTETYSREVLAGSERDTEDYGYGMARVGVGLRL